MEPEFKDHLRPKRILQILPNGVAICLCDNDEPVELQLYWSPGGTISAKRAEPPPIDQLGERPKLTTAQKWANVDQV